jgi:type II secretory pathway component PulM
VGGLGFLSGDVFAVNACVHVAVEPASSWIMSYEQALQAVRLSTSRFPHLLNEVPKACANAAQQQIVATETSTILLEQVHAESSRGYKGVCLCYI